MMPFFSIIIPTYNRSAVIIKAIESVLKQSFSDYELIIVDDGSTDNTKNIVELFSYEKRIKYLYQTNRGVCAARNTGAKSAQGRYLIFLDSDDIVEIGWLDDFYELCKQKYEIVSCNMKIIKLNNHVMMVSALDPYKDAKSKGNILAGSWVVERTLFFRAGMFDENIKFGENVELHIRLNKYFPKIGIVDKYNFTYCESANGGSKNLKNKIESNFLIISKHPDYFRQNKNILRFYYQNNAVAFAKLKEWNSARIYFWKAYMIDVKEVKTLVRYIVSLFPFVAVKLWKQNEQ